MRLRVLEVISFLSMFFLLHLGSIIKSKSSLAYSTIGFLVDLHFVSFTDSYDMDHDCIFDDFVDDSVSLVVGICFLQSYQVVTYVSGLSLKT